MPPADDFYVGYLRTPLRIVRFVTYVAIVLLLLLPSPWNLVGFAVLLPLWILELLGWNRTVKHRRRGIFLGSGSESKLHQAAHSREVCGCPLPEIEVHVRSRRERR